MPPLFCLRARNHQEIEDIAKAEILKPLQPAALIPSDQVRLTKADDLPLLPLIVCIQATKTPNLSAKILNISDQSSRPIFGFLLLGRLDLLGQADFDNLIHHLETVNAAGCPARLMATWLPELLYQGTSPKNEPKASAVFPRINYLFWNLDPFRGDRVFHEARPQDINNLMDEMKSLYTLQLGLISAYGSDLINFYYRIGQMMPGTLSLALNKPSWQKNKKYLGSAVRFPS